MRALRLVAALGGMARSERSSLLEVRTARCSVVRGGLAMRELKPMSSGLEGRPARHAARWCMEARS